MENQQTNHSPGKELIRNLAIAITNNTIDIAKVDKFRINLELKKYKDNFGVINYSEIQKIPLSDRLPAMSKNDLGGTIKLVTVAITLAMEAMNLKRPMTNGQVVDLAEAVVDSMNEGNDFLTMPDLMLFLQKFSRGEYGEFYEGLDQSKFFKKLDQYRDERFETFKESYYEKHDEYKEMGNSKRVRESSDNPLDIHLSQMSNKVQSLKDELKEQKDINKRMREDF